MSTFTRIINEQVYQWQRKQLRKQKRQITPYQTLKMPQIISFRVEGDTQQPTYSPMPPRRNRSRQDTAALKKCVGVIMIAVGCLLFLTKCFGGEEEQVVEEATYQPTFQMYIQDFDIDETTLHALLQYSKKYQLPYAHALSVWALESYKGTAEKKIYDLIREQPQQTDIETYGLYEDGYQVYKQFIYDLMYFPVEDIRTVAYEEGWKEQRHFNGERLHYGTDIMACNNKSGVIPVQSITNGIVENIGWNQTGGYRVGIRSDGGAYFYYAHLDAQPAFLEKGQYIEAGACIGYMGDTGYGEEGTRGLFPVHLHLGIAVTTQASQEYWINPYPVLKYLEKYGCH